MKIPVLFLRYTAILILPAVIFLSACHKSSDDTVTLTPVATTNPIISDLTSTSATAGGTVTDYVANTITSYGVCWSATNKTPTTADSKTTTTTANAVFFSGGLTGLTPGTLYYLRAYAVSASGTVYGDVIQFTTLSATGSTYGTVSTFAGSGAPGFVNNTGLAAQFNSVQGVATDAQGNVYVADSFNNSIRKITPSGVTTTLAGDGTIGFADGAGATAHFYSPIGLAADAQGNIYVADQGNNAIRKVTAAGVVTTLAGGSGVGYTDATGAAAKFNNPAGLTVDAQGNVYVADKGNNVIRKITAAGVVTTLCGAKTASFADGAATTASFNSPSGVALDGKGNLYVADLGNHAIRKVTIADGTVSTLLGNPTAQPNVVNLPVSITADNKGDFFIVDEGGRILELSSANILYNLAGQANSNGFTNGQGNAAMFDSPQGIAVDAQGNVFVADNNNNVIRKIVVTTAP